MPDVMKTVGRYEILREVGRGGMAMVYLARQTDLDRFVALKELGAFHASDPSFAQRFLRESRVAGSLSHPNIVTVHDYFEHDGTPYIAMEYIERGSLRPYVGRMTMAQIGGVLEGLLAGLTNAESHGIVHRDLKPENLMVTADGRVKIADFGIAKATTKMQTGAFLTATGTTVGTPTYMAPEQAMAQDIGPWTDLYSVGCMAFELFTGNVPFHDSDAPMAILLRHVNEPIPPVKSIVPEVDQRTSDWIEALLVKEPSQRTQNAQDAWDDFEEILLGLLGPRWRREARLVERVEESDGAKPLTPAPFEGTTAGEPASDEFKSFAWGAPSETGGSPAAPPMYTPPPSASAPSIPEPVVGPPTPMPSQAIPAPPPPAPGEPIADSGFVTFGAPAPAPPTDALVPPPAAAPEAFAPAPEQPAAVTPPPVEALPPRDTHGPGFETYVAPPPSQPPLDEPPPSAAAPPVAPAPTAPQPAAEPVAQQAAAEPIAETVMPRALREQPPETPKAPATERPARRFPVVPVAIAGGVLAVVLIALVVLGGGGSDKAATGAQKTSPPKPPAAIPVSGSGIALEVPGSWKSSDAPAVPGMRSGAVSVGGGNGAVVFGRADKTAANSTLLADDLRAAAGTLPAKASADLGEGVQAYRYDELGIGGGKSATVFAVPTSKGVATLACTADAKTCESIAGTMRITSGKPFPVGPSKAYASRLSRSLSSLGRTERSAASQLKQARKRTTQVAATARIGTAYAAAAKSLAGRSLSPADVFANRQLVASLRATGKAYTRAAGEGRRKDRAGYAREGRKAVAAHKDVAAAVAKLKAAGYNLPGSIRQRFATATRLPTLRKDPKPVVVHSTGGGSAGGGTLGGGSTGGGVTGGGVTGGGSTGGGSTGGGGGAVGGGSTGGGTTGGGSTGGGSTGGDSTGGGGSSGGGSSGGGGSVSGGGEG